MVLCRLSEQKWSLDARAVGGTHVGFGNQLGFMSFYLELDLDSRKY